MNIGFTQANNKSPNFGMALKIDKSATPVIKNKFLLSIRDHKDSFKTTINEVAKRQAQNPVDIFIKGDKGKLVAEVVDSEAGLELGYPQVQKLFPQDENGLKKHLDSSFILSAEICADKLKSVNDELIEMIKNTEKAVTK